MVANLHRNEASQMSNNTPTTSFTGEYLFLSNFHP